MMEITEDRLLRAWAGYVERHGDGCTQCELRTARSVYDIADAATNHAVVRFQSEQCGNLLAFDAFTFISRYEPHAPPSGSATPA